MREVGCRDVLYIFMKIIGGRMLIMIEALDFGVEGLDPKL